MSEQMQNKKGDKSPDMQIRQENRQHKQEAKKRFGRIVVCLVLALGIWIYIYNINNTGITNTYQLQIEFEGEAKLLELKELSVYDISTETVSVVVQGSNRDLRRFEASDYHVIANVADIDEAGKKAITLKVVLPNDTTLSTVSVEPASVTVSTDTNIKKNVPFEAVAGSITTVKDYNYEVLCDTTSINVSGPQMVVSNIEKAVYRINPGFVSKSLSITGIIPTFLDKNGDEVLLSGNSSWDEHDINIRLDVSTKKTVPIVVDVDTSLYTWVIKDNSIKNVTLIGDPSVLDGINAYMIDNYGNNPDRTEYVHPISNERFNGEVQIEEQNKLVEFSIKKIVTAGNGND